MKAPTLLILYPATGTFCEEVLAYLAKQRTRRRLRIILADESSVTSHEEMFDDFIRVPPYHYVKETFELLSKYLGKSRIDAIYMQSVAALPIGSLLAREFGLPGPSLESVYFCINKYLSREKLSRCGIPIPEFMLGENTSDVFRAAERFGYPLVLKAVASAHSRLVTLLNSREDIEPAVRYLKASLPQSGDISRLSSFSAVANLEPGCSPTRQFLIESFLAGDALESDGIIYGGKPVTFGITKQIPSKEPPFFIEGYLCPVDYPEKTLAGLQRLSDEVITAIGLDNTGFSIEMRTNKNHTGIIEVNGRLGRDDGFGEMFKAYTGSLPSLQALKLSMGVKPECICKRNIPTAVAYRSCYEDGFVEDLPGGENIQNLMDEGVIYGTPCQIGTRMYKSSHPATLPHLAWTLAQHPESSKLAYLKACTALDRLSISVQPC